MAFSRFTAIGAILAPVSTKSEMPYYPRVPSSDATRGSGHSSAIMYIPEPWEFNHTPLSRMGTPVDRPGTPFSQAKTPGSDYTLQPNSHNEIIPYQNAPGPLSHPGGTNQFTSRNEVMPYYQTSSYPSNKSSGCPCRAEHDGEYSDVLRRATEQRCQHIDDRSQDLHPIARTLHTPSRQPDERRSNSGILGPMALLGSAFLMSSIGRGNSGHSQRDHRDRDNADRTHRRRTSSYDSDDDENYRADNPYRSRRPRDHDRYEDQRSSPR